MINSYTTHASVVDYRYLCYTSYTGAQQRWEELEKTDSESAPFPKQMSAGTGVQESAFFNKSRSGTRSGFF